MKTVIKSDIGGKKENKENLKHSKSSFKNAKENTKSNRNALKVLQQSVSTLQSLTGRGLEEQSKVANSSDVEAKNEKKIVEVSDKGVQTGETVITAADLTSSEPSADYWKLLAEKREKSLNENLKEKERLTKILEELQEENKTCKKMLEESKLLVEVLQEMLEDNDSGTRTEEAPETTEER